MQISLESINEIEDPYQAFVDSIKSPQTLRKYRTHLHRFLKLIPNQVYADTLGKEPESNSIEELAKFLVDLGRKDPKTAHNIIAAFVKEDRKKVDNKQISPNTFPTHVKPIRRLLDANSIPIHWKSLHRLFPRGSVTKDRAYSREEPQNMYTLQAKEERDHQTLWKNRKSLRRASKGIQRAVKRDREHNTGRFHGGDFRGISWRKVNELSKMWQFKHKLLFQECQKEA